MQSGTKESPTLSCQGTGQQNSEQRLIWFRYKLRTLLSTLYACTQARSPRQTVPLVPPLAPLFSSLAAAAQQFLTVLTLYRLVLRVKTEGVVPYVNSALNSICPAFQVINWQQATLLAAII